MFCSTWWSPSLKIVIKMKPLTKSLCWWTSINSKTLLLSKLRSLSITRFDVLIFNYCWIWVMIWVMKLFLKYGLFKALIFIIYIVKENITFMISYLTFSYILINVFIVEFFRKWSSFQFYLSVFHCLLKKVNEKIISPVDIYNWH